MCVRVRAAWREIRMDGEYGEGAREREVGGFCDSCLPVRVGYAASLFSLSLWPCVCALTPPHHPAAAAAARAFCCMTAL